MISQITIDSCDPSLSVVIEACAGSGKTWLLVSRVLRLLLSGAKPSEILAITFTRKAAQEMRCRLDEMLLKFASCSDDELLSELTQRGLDDLSAKELFPIARTLFESVLSDPHGLAIDTFHGWFSRLLKGAPIGCGVPQGLTLREDFKRLQIECLEGWWSNLNKNESLKTAYELLVRELGAVNANNLLIGSKGFLSAKAEWYRYLDWCRIHKKSPSQAISQLSDYLEVENPLKQALSKSENLSSLMALASYLKEGGVSDIKVSQSIYSGLQQISQGSNFDQIANTLRPAFLNADLQILTRISASGDLKRSLNHLTDCEEVIKKINVARLFWAETLLSYYQWRSDVRAHEIHQAWILLGADMLAHYQSQKEILRVQDFSDLEAYTAQIMLSSDIAAYLQARLDAKYKHLLIDEFQDTNPIQWQILLSWLNAYGQDVHKPTVFLVGDPKQSIYRFRRADVRLFGVAKKYLEDNFSAKYHLFNETRRNSPAVLQAVNQVFGLSDLPETYPFKEQKRNASAKNLYGHGDVFLLPLISPKEIVKPLTRNALKLPYVDVNSETKQKQSYEEAVQVAKLIRWLKDSRSAQWNDFLVLMRSRTHLRQVENAFRDFGIPCDSPRQGGLLKTLEADDLIALLSVLVTPSDDLSLTQVLRSPIYSLSDDQLLNLVNYQQVNEFDSLWIAISKSDCFFHHAYTQIIRWVELAKTLPVHDLLDFIYHDAEIRLRYAQSVPALQLDRVLSNLDAFLLLALDLDGGRYPSLPRFIRELKQIKRGAEEESPDEGDSADQESDELTDSQTKRVRIMTIHAAKGLEARFVFIMNANANRFNKDSVGVLMNWPPESTSPTHISPFFSDKLKDLARQELRDEEEKIAEIENWNLLYVALTRAKESIYISGLEVSGSNGIAEKSWYGRLMKAGVPKISSELLTATDLSVSINENLVVELNEYLDFQVNWKGHSSPRLYFDEEIISVEQKILIDKGVAFHKLMEHLMRSNITESKDLPSEIHLMNWLSLDSSYVSDLRNAANHLLSSSITKKFFSDPLIMNSWNELDISDDAGRILRIDRLIELPNELIIVDYKMNIPDVGHDLYQKYSEQLATYRRCITSLRTDKPVKSYLLTPKGDVLELR